MCLCTRGSICVSLTKNNNFPGGLLFVACCILHSLALMLSLAFSKNHLKAKISLKIQLEMYILHLATNRNCFASVGCLSFQRLTTASPTVITTKISRLLLLVCSNPVQSTVGGYNLQMKISPAVITLQIENMNLIILTCNALLVPRRL